MSDTPTSVREQKRRTRAASILSAAAELLRLYGITTPVTPDKMQELANNIYTGKVVAP